MPICYVRNRTDRPFHQIYSKFASTESRTLSERPRLAEQRPGNYFILCKRTITQNAN